ncbi:hypothetical protein D6D13_07757 [Aureobasidium pullulans]|uniref:Uncharacterized protein n=1 Tax=Aureobasidium pullulans TaxID=5580 RepID=A0A4S9CC57_AURPU|nr:hypothetical protein D6D13_07757 [Aureobasidium pullulans]
MTGLQGLQEQIKGNARIIYRDVDNFAIEMVESPSHSPGASVWSAKLVTHNPNGSSRLLLGAVGGSIGLALLLLLSYTARLLRELNW